MGARDGHIYPVAVEDEAKSAGTVFAVAGAEGKDADRSLLSLEQIDTPDRCSIRQNLLQGADLSVVRLQETADGRAVPFVAKALCLADQTIDPKTAAYKEIDRNLIVDRGDLAAFETNWDRLFPRRHPVPEEERKVFLDSLARDISPREIKHFVTETDRILLRQYHCGVSGLGSAPR